MSKFELARRYDTISLYRGGAAAKLELNRPDRLNALNDELARQLLALLQEVGADPSVRSVLITGAGAGRAFSSGNDMLQPVHGDSAVRNLLSEVYYPMLRTVRGMPKAGHQRGERPGGGHRRGPGAGR